MTAADFLQMQQICKSYDSTLVLNQVDFSAQSGEVHAISGENGAGKSTLMKILTGAVPKNSGEIWLDGKAIEIKSPIIAQQIGIRAVYQEFSLVSHLSITENILMGRLPQKSMRGWVDFQSAHEKATQLLDRIGFPGLDVRRHISDLSVSHQQMVEIAKALVDKPRILILDEPSAVLSQDELKRLFELIGRLKREGTLILYISHRLDEVFEIADRITVLKDGQYVGTVKPSETDQPGLIRMMVGRTLSEIYPSRKAQNHTPLLEVQNLNKKGSLFNVSFNVGKGEIVGVFGLVGSGRTEVARCIFGADKPASGKFFLNGIEINVSSPKKAVRVGIALLTEDRKRDGLVMNCSIGDNMALASLDQVSRMGFINFPRREKNVISKVNELKVKPSNTQRLVRFLSGGNQQKVILGKWLLTNAKVLLLDEPTRGVDVATKAEVYQLIHTLAERGIGIFLISSELPEILGMSDRVLVMREGKMVGEFNRDQATEEKLLTCAAGVNQ